MCILGARRSCLKLALDTECLRTVWISPSSVLATTMADVPSHHGCVQRCHWFFNMDQRRTAMHLRTELGCPPPSRAGPTRSENSFGLVLLTCPPVLKAAFVLALRSQLRRMGFDPHNYMTRPIMNGSADVPLIVPSVPMYTEYASLVADPVKSVLEVSERSEIYSSCARRCACDIGARFWRVARSIQALGHSPQHAKGVG